jgi:glycerol-3-phosphate dehydrogenase
MESREQRWHRLGREQFDVLVIGGGITGAGAVRDAARRGLRVALVEAEDFAYGTSSRSSKLVHGGLRYLEHGEFSLVFEAVSERRVLQNIAPHLVNPLGFLFPIYASSKRGVNTIRVGLWLYDGLSLFRSPRLHRTLSRKQVQVEEPQLNVDQLKGCPLYFDCATDDARLTLETILDATACGAVPITYARVEGLVRDEKGRIAGAQVRDRLHDRITTVRATTVINATGPWTDRTRSMGQGGKPLLSPTKGVHMVVDKRRLHLNNAVVLRHPDDARVMFAIPWGDRTYVGTTDTFYDGDPADVCASSEDVDYLLAATNAFFPRVGLTRDDVIATWAGLRPLISEDSENASSVSREHEIVMDSDGLITIAGGKLTTFRRMGAEVISRALELMALLGKVPEGVRDAHTGREPLPGAVGWPEDDNHEAVQQQAFEAGGGAVDLEQARYLVDHYGTRGIDLARLMLDKPRLQERLVQGRPETLALVDWSIDMEMACTVRDVLIRRTQLYYRDYDQGLGAAEQVADHMADRLGWSEERRTNEVLAYQQEVTRSRRWRSD